MRVYLCLLLATLAAALPHQRADSPTLAISPTPQKVTVWEETYPVRNRAQIVTDTGSDKAAIDAVTALLQKHGAKKISQVDPGSEAKGNGITTVRIGSGNRTDIHNGLRGAANVPAQAEGYALVVNGNGVTIGGTDGAGQFYGVQTLAQLFSPGKPGSSITHIYIEDYPLMPLRGTIEGFYGEPWTDQARLDHLDWLATVKANTYVYTPKDDPYLRAEWRDLYPADRLEGLKKLVERASANHVHFTYAVSPGVSVCFSDQADRDTMLAKLQQVYDLGARAFSIPFDDISYTKWNCELDQTTYGAPGQGAAGNAQVDFLNYVQKQFIETHEGSFPLQTVPTEYSDLNDTPYKTAIREKLDPNVIVQWTGTEVVPPYIKNVDAQACAKNFGRKVFLWDNYPVNDWDDTRGRLLLAPYKYRDAGLHDHLQGIVGNPMNQAHASRVALFSIAAFAWNDQAFDAEASWRASMNDLASGDRVTAEALLVLGDMEHEAPIFGPNPWQPPAPVLASKILRVNGTGHNARDLVDLAGYAQYIASAPATIRAGPVPAGFLVDVEPWLKGMELWGSALPKSVYAQQALDRYDGNAARNYVAEAQKDVAAAKQLQVTPKVNRWSSHVPVLANGVMDRYIDYVANLANR